MSRGKIDSISSKAYNDSKNPEINNTQFDSKRMGVLNKDIEPKKPQFYTRYIKNKSGSVSMSRDPSSLTNREARKKFLSLVCNYEELNEVKLCDISTNERILPSSSFTITPYSLGSATFVPTTVKSESAA